MARHSEQGEQDTNGRPETSREADDLNAVGHEGHDPTDAAHVTTSDLCPCTKQS